MLEQFDQQLVLSSVWRCLWIVRAAVEASAAIRSNLKAAFQAFSFVSALRCAAGGSLCFGCSL